MTDAPAPSPALDKSRLIVPAGWHVEISDASASTNADMAARARDGADEGQVIVTEHQTAGRGRLDRAWETPPRAALTGSILLRPDIPGRDWPWIPLLIGYAVQAALGDRLPAVGLKWPNDVLVEERKVAGILVERIETPRGPAAVAGIGINVSQTLEQLPVALATSVELETGERVDRTQLLGQVLGSVHGLLGLLEDPAALRSAYVDVCTTIGREVDVHLPGGDVRRGDAVDLDDQGALVVSTPEGLLTVAAGDVVHVRAVA